MVDPNKLGGQGDDYNADDMDGEFYEGQADAAEQRKIDEKRGKITNRAKYEREPDIFDTDEDIEDSKIKEWAAEGADEEKKVG